MEELAQSVHVLIHEATIASMGPHHHGLLADELTTGLGLLHLQHALCLEIFTLHATHGAGTYLHSVALGDLVHVLGLGHSSHASTHSLARILTESFLVLHEHRHRHVAVELPLVLESRAKTLP